MTAPRDYLIDGHDRLFGKSTNVEWKAPSSFDENVRLRAAQTQHAAALDFRKFLKAQGVRIGEFAERRHLNAEGLRRKLRGEMWMNLRDLAMLELGRDSSEGPA